MNVSHIFWVRGWWKSFSASNKRCSLARTVFRNLPIIEGWRIIIFVKFESFEFVKRKITAKISECVVVIKCEVITLHGRFKDLLAVIFVKVDSFIRSKHVFTQIITLILVVLVQNNLKFLTNDFPINLKYLAVFLKVADKLLGDTVRSIVTQDRITWTFI